MPGPSRSARRLSPNLAGPSPTAGASASLRGRLGAQNTRGNAAVQDAIRSSGGLTDSGTANATTTATSTTTNTATNTGATGLDEQALQSVVDAAVAVSPESIRTYAESAIPGILRQTALAGIKNANQAAYILATAEHESKFGKPTYDRSESLVEDRNPFSQGRNGKWSATEHVTGRGVSAGSEDELETKYWDSAYGGRLGNEKGTTDGRDFRGRGYVQLTGRSNYESMTRHLNEVGFSYTIDGQTWGGAGNPAIDLAAHPDHVNRVPELAARIMVDGMRDGSFTGSSLGDHINDEKTDYKNARRVVNGDTATNGESIATIARRYQGALGGWSSVFKAEQA